MAMAMVMMVKAPIFNRFLYQTWPPKPSATDIKGWGDDADIDGEY
jgi:hypothetical protein